uniref:ZP domain-containing protein n=1 Tax=Erpetoichthys calabaricus TaxID=27687 RepID=A0A8C4S964_ERPCA
MSVTLLRSYIESLGYNASQLHLNDDYCRAQNYGSEIIFRFPLNRCGTSREVRRISFTRSMKVCLIFHVLGYVILNPLCHVLYKQYMYLFKNPYIVDLNEDIFVQIVLYTSDYLEVFIDTCTAAPSQFGYPSYEDDTFVASPSTSFDIARFRFNAFKFVDYSSSVYLECKVVLCQMYDYSSRCNRGCQARRRRDLSSSKDKVDIVSGRIELRKDKNLAGKKRQFQLSIKSNTFLLLLIENKGFKISSTQTLVWISMIALATTTVILAFFTLKFYKKQQRMKGNFNRL